MLIAAVVKSADTRDLKSLGVKSVPVQVRSAAFFNVLIFLFGLGDVYLHKVNDWLIIFIRFTL